MIIAVSEQVKIDLINKFGINPNLLRVIINCTNKMYIKVQANEEINELLWDKEYKYILNVGRLSEQKAQWKLLKSLRHLYNVHPDLKIKLIILGEGPLKDSLLTLSNLLSLNEVVHVLPFNSNPFKFIKRVDLFVLPSIFEGCPIVLSEVIALECPFIGSQKAIPIELFGWKKSSWNKSTYCNLNLIADFTKSIFSDDIELSNLIYDHLYFKKEDNSVLACQEWNEHNDKKYQFDAYLQLFDKTI